MKRKDKKLMEHLNKELKVIEFNDIEYTLENGDIYPHLFDICKDLTLEEFQNLLNESKKIISNLVNGEE